MNVMRGNANYLPQKAHIFGIQCLARPVDMEQTQKLRHWEICNLGNGSAVNALVRRRSVDKWSLLIEQRTSWTDAALTCPFVTPHWHL